MLGDDLLGAETSKVLSFGMHNGFVSVQGWLWYCRAGASATGFCWLGSLDLFPDV